MIYAGKYNELTVTEELKHGFYLISDSGEQVFLHRQRGGRIPEIGNQLNLFVYTDNKYGFVATYLEPHAILGEFVVLKVCENGRGGAMLDWGIEERLVLPPSEQIRPLRKGDSCLVYIYLDELSGRITATTKLEYCLERRKISAEPGSVCNLMVWKVYQNEIRVIVDQQYEGKVSASQLSDRTLEVGEELTGYIHYIRPDRRIDIVIKETEADIVESAMNTILQELRRNSGYLRLSGNSDPRRIKADLNITKRIFTQAINSLNKEQQIIIGDQGISLIPA